jgi:hypothetical protein
MSKIVAVREKCLLCVCVRVCVYVCVCVCVCVCPRLFPDGWEAFQI